MTDQKITGTLAVTDKVGIGTESPLAQLHISSSTSAPSQAFLESSGALLKITVDSSGASIGTDNAFPLSILTDNSPRLSITDDGKVGIGTTTTPTERLEVNGNLTVNGAIAANKLTVSGNVSFGDADNDEVKITGVLRSGHSSGSLRVDDALHATGSLTVDGNVGIDTTSPSNFKLNIGGTGGQNALHVASDFGFREEDKLNLIRFGSDGDYQVLHKASGAFGRNTLAMHVHADDAFGVYSTGWNPLFEIQGETGNVYLKGKVGIGTTNPSATLDVRGDLKINGDFQFPNSDGGLAKLTPHKYSNESSFKKNNVKLSLGSRSVLAPIGQPPLEYEFAVGHTFSGLIADPITGIRLYTDFVKKFSVNQDGDAYFAGSKGGYVVDYFVNRVGDTLEQGDVVIISEHQVSHYSGSQNNIPIPEVDLTDIPYNSRVCGIVAKVTTERDLPYVEEESQTQPEMQPEEIKELEVSDIEILHPLKALAAESKEDLDITKIPDQQMGTMVTLGAFAHCKVDADIAPIQVGDLLTTSSTRGHAQKVLEPERAIGAIIAKALKSLEKGKDKIPVLVIFQ